MSVGPSAAHPPVAAAAAAVVALLAVGAGAVAMARPSMDTTANERRSSVMITLDVSESMTKTDLQPSRLAAAVDAAERFSAAAPSGTAIGVTTFADRAAVVLAPTTDRAAVQRALDGHRQTRVGTALGAAVTTSLGGPRFGRRHRGPASRRPVRLAGAHPGADRRRQLHPARPPRRRTPPSAPPRTACRSTRSCSATTRAGPTSRCPPRRSRRCRTRTGGIFAQSTSTADLQAVFADIGSIVAPVPKVRELTVWVAGLAIALLALAALLAGLARPRAPGLRGPSTA